MPRKPFRPKLLSRRGRPFQAMLALDEAPPIDLALHETGQLAAIRRAGPHGLPLGDGLSVSIAIRLALAGKVEILPGPSQRVLAVAARRREAA